MSKGRGEDRMEAFLRKVLRTAGEKATVDLTLHPQRADAHNKSPDFVVDAKIVIELFPQCPVVVQLPILVEVEASGFTAGKEDLKRFAIRSREGVDPLGPRIELPFIIATEAAAGNRETQDENLPVRILLREVSIPEEP
jgi:hypothetical protein